MSIELKQAAQHAVDAFNAFGDAVNLARNYLDGMYPNGLTPKGVRILAEAIMRMDEVLRK